MGGLFLPIQTFEYHEEITSTNDRVRELLLQAVKPQLPCLVIAKRQTAGRGRGNKRWWSGEGALLMSLGLELFPEFLSRKQLPACSATAARVVAKVLRQYLQFHKIDVHLPNDVLVDDKKICGILLESPTPQYCILGIGLNVNNQICDMPAEFLADRKSQSIISMIELLGKETDIDQLTNELLIELNAEIAPPAKEVFVYY